MKQAAVTKKPSITALSEQAATFAEAPQAIKNSPAIGQAGKGGKSLSGLVPVNDVRLTANIRQDLHLKLKIEAAHRRTTIGEILEYLIEHHLEIQK